jgi:hypothetical protein
VRAAALGVLLTAATIAATTSPIAARNATPQCGSELWSIKTFSDPRRNLVSLRPVRTTVGAIAARPMPRPTPRHRSRGYERHIWRITAEITAYKLGEDGDLHLILFDNGDYMIAEMPSPSCLSSTTRDRRAIINAREYLDRRCPPSNGGWRSLGGVADISGVGFWDVPHGQRGHAKNYAELHPVTHISLISGCA